MIKFALPKGRLLKTTSSWLSEVGLGFEEYRPETRFYRVKSSRFAQLDAKVFHEKDIPIQVAVGNYDLGICGSDWIEELFSRFPSTNVVKLRSLGYGIGALYTAVSVSSSYNQLEDLYNCKCSIRIASEYPKIAETLAEKLKLKHFYIIPVWGSSHVYPPENAELVILPRKDVVELNVLGLRSIGILIDFDAYLIANRKSLESNDLSTILSNLMTKPHRVTEATEKSVLSSTVTKVGDYVNVSSDTIRLALPDGHQQPHVRRIFDKANIQIEDYPSQTGTYRPKSDLEGVTIKMIRPQDMPMIVASDGFDVAITGQDWLADHLYAFPNSPIKMLLDLKYGRVKVVAVVDNELPVGNPLDLREYFNDRTIHIASEYTSIADFYARSNHFKRYRIIPTWGATEAFLPEDADILVENTETGSTIRRHNLKIIDTLFESTACVIASSKALSDKKKLARINSFVTKLRATVETDNAGN